MRRHLFSLITALAILVGSVPAARAAVVPALSLDQSAGTQAGSMLNLGLDLKFADTGTDSPRDLTLNLPSGLLADAAINGGACLKTTNLTGTACQVGTGTVTATPDPIPGVLNLPLSVSVPVTFHLVPPPSSGDLAGLAVTGLGEQIGSTGEIKLRPTGDPAGVGVTLDLVLPDHLPVTVPLIGTINTAQISLTEINSTFDRLRYPATCPGTPAQVNATVDSYSDPTVHTVSAPLSVTGCSSLPFAPVFKVDAVRDTGDRQVTLKTTVTQASGESPARAISLSFPAATLAPNLASIQALCRNLGSGTCAPVGSVTASSPLYPAPLRGQGYLTGSSAGLALTLVFPPPFPLTLTGAVDLVKNSATFTGVPDIPLTNLQVSLNGGADGLFLSTCQAPSGTATALLTDQNGDRTVNAPSKFTVSGCSGSTSGGAASTPAGVTVGATNLSSSRFSGLSTGHPSLVFTVRVAKSAPRLRVLTVELPAGLSFAAPRRGRLSGLTVAGARIRSLRLSHGHLVITFQKPVARVRVRITNRALAESPKLKGAAPRQRAMWLTLIAENMRAKRTLLHVRVLVVSPRGNG